MADRTKVTPEQEAVEMIVACMGWGKNRAKEVVSKLDESEMAKVIKGDMSVCDCALDVLRTKTEAPKYDGDET